jgi:hypothetical protein
MGRPAILVTALAACRAAAPTPPPPAPTPPRALNADVLALLTEYPAGGFGGYAWPSPPGQAGTTRDLTLGGHLLARGGDGNHCVGVTLEVFWRALAGCPGGVEAALDVDGAEALKRTWYVPVAGGAGAAEALPAHALGERVATLDDARPGDFLQGWAPDRSIGHSAIFLGWDRDDAGAIAGVRYWSSQPWTDGIGESSMVLGDDGFDRAQVYLARATCQNENE